MVNCKVIKEHYCNWLLIKYYSKHMLVRSYASEWMTLEWFSSGVCTVVESSNPAFHESVQKALVPLMWWGGACAKSIFGLALKTIFFFSLIFKLNFSPYKNSEQPLQFIFPFRLIHNLMITIYKILNDL